MSHPVPIQPRVGDVLREVIPADSARAPRLTRLLTPGSDGRPRVDDGLSAYIHTEDGGIARYRARSFHRGAPAARVSASLEFGDHHLVPGAMTDLSIRGAAVTVNGPVDAAWRSGLVTATWDGASVRLAFDVKRRLSSGDKTLLGLDVRPATHEDAAAWLHLVTGALFPHTRAARPDDLDALWLLLQQQYFHLSGKTPTDFAAHREPFLRDNGALAANPLLGHVVTWPQEGTIAFLRTHAHTFMGHQIARAVPRYDSPASTTVLRELYLHGFERTRLQPDVRWVAGFVNSSVRWMEVHTDHARIPGSGSYASPMRLIEIDCHDEPTRAPSDLVVRPFAATDAEATLLVLAAARRGRAYVDSLDLTPDHLGVGVIAGQFERAGLARDRLLLVAERDGMPLAAAVADAVAPGVNLFALHDAVRLFVLDHDLSEADRVEAFTELLCSARSWYQGLGRRHFAWIAEHHDEAEVVDATRDQLPHHDCGPGHYWILDAERVADFLEYVREATARAPRLGVAA